MTQYGTLNRCLLRRCFLGRCLLKNRPLKHRLRRPRLFKNSQLQKRLLEEHLLIEPLLWGHLLKHRFSRWRSKIQSELIRKPEEPAKTEAWKTDRPIEMLNTAALVEPPQIEKPVEPPKRSSAVVQPPPTSRTSPSQVSTPALTAKESEAIAVQSEQDTVQPDQDVAQPDQDIEQPDQEIEQPDQNIEQPELSVKQREQNIVVQRPTPQVPDIPEAGTVQPEQDIAQPEQDVAQPLHDVAIAKPHQITVQPEDAITLPTPLLTPSGWNGSQRSHIGQGHRCVNPCEDRINDQHYATQLRTLGGVTRNASPSHPKPIEATLLVLGIVARTEFGDMINVLGGLPYFQYLKALQDYLEGFMRRTKPLENLDKLFASFDKEFEQAWIRIRFQDGRRPRQLRHL
jgi:hypothetical protein